MKSTTRKPRRVTQAKLEALAAIHQKPIEFDNDRNVGFLKLDKPKREFYASLDERAS